MKKITEAEKIKILKNFKNKNFNYKIIRIKNNKKITMKTFYAKNNDDAYEYLKKYIKCANKKYKYYFDKYDDNVVVDNYGKIHQFENIVDCIKFEACLKPWYKRIYCAISDFFFDLTFSIKDFYCDVKNLLFLIKTKHNKSEKWSLDSHIFDDIIFNMPSLINNATGVSNIYIEEAIKKMNIKIDNIYDLETNSKYIKLRNKVYNVAGEIQKKSRQDFLNYVKTYTDLLNFDNTNKIIPYVNGSYSIIDYKKYDILCNKYWNKICNWFQKYGKTLWD